MSSLGATALDSNVVSLAQSTDRRHLLAAMARFAGVSLAASIGLQVFRPFAALGAGCPSWCGPSPQCASQCCLANGYCNSWFCAPTSYSWTVELCNTRYRCVDCMNAGEKCWCVQSIGAVDCHVC